MAHDVKLGFKIRPCRAPVKMLNSGDTLHQQSSAHNLIQQARLQHNDTLRTDRARKRGREEDMGERIRAELLLKHERLFYLNRLFLKSVFHYSWVKFSSQQHGPEYTL